MGVLCAGMLDCVYVGAIDSIGRYVPHMGCIMGAQGRGRFNMLYCRYVCMRVCVYVRVCRVMNVCTLVFVRMRVCTGSFLSYHTLSINEFVHLCSL